MYRLHEVHDDEIGLLEQLYEEVLVPSFPADELDERWWREPENRRPTLTIVALAPDDSIVGGVVGEWYAAERILLIAYLAVRREARGDRVGTALMGAAADRWYGRFEPLVVLGELRDPRHHPNDEYAAIRIHFYDRLGAKVLAVPYFQPRLRPTGPRVYHMLLAAFHVSPEALSRPDAVDAAVLAAFLDRYVLECEGEAALVGDPAVRWLRGFFTTDREIPLLALGRYREVPDPEPPGRLEATGSARLA
jgi:GNAT superfamily N-acetyltransferase